MTTPRFPDQIQAIIFDLGRVLVQVNLKGGLFKLYFGDGQIGDQEILNQVFKNEIFIAFNTGKIEPQHLYQSLIAKYNLDMSFEQFVQEWCAILTPMPDMAELVIKLATRYRLGILSDTDPLHWQYCLRQFPYLQLFTKPTLSFQTGFLKPDPRCYNLAAENTGAAMGSCLFIDDREENVIGAQQAGMPALQFTNPESLHREFNKLHIL